MTTEQFQAANQKRHGIRDAINGQQALLHATERSVQLWEAQQMVDITDATNGDTGKPLYSNPEKRQAELLTRQQASNEFSALEEVSDAIKCELAKMRADLEEVQSDIDFAIVSAGQDRIDGAIAELFEKVDATIAARTADAVRRSLHAVLGGVATSLLTPGEKLIGVDIVSETNF